MKRTISLLRDPLTVILQNRSEFSIWFLFTIITGQIGIIANIIIRHYSEGASIKESIIVDSVNGSFYTFSIALVASILGPLFINLINSKVLRFRTLKVYTIIISFFFLIFSGIVYAVIQSKNGININLKNITIDWTQFIVYIFAILIVFYGYCILRLENNPDKYKSLDDAPFNEIDDEEVKDRIEQSKLIKDDGKGIKL